MEQGFCRMVLVVADDADPAAAAVIGRIADSLRAQGYSLMYATTARDGAAQVRANPAIGCVLLDWDIGAADTRERHSLDVIRAVRRLSDDLPIFLLTSRTVTGNLPLEVQREIQEYVWLMEDTPDFIAGRVSFAVLRYERGLLPPFFRALAEFSDEHEYSWHTPGHSGGTAFLKTPVGQVFHDFLGEQVFRSDLSVSVPELGSLLDHSGPAGAAEANAARIFGADMTFFVLNGTSTANQVVGHSCIVAGDVVLADNPECWVLHPGEDWHGFGGMEDGYCMLDPIKVTITTPGVDAAGAVADQGIPAQIVTQFLDERGIEVCSCETRSNGWRSTTWAAGWLP